MTGSNRNSVLTSPAGEKFVPTCEICGNNHWPFDPSCIGKKGVKENAKRKAKEAKIALKKAAIAAKNEKKRKKTEAKNARTQNKEKIKADKKARFEAVAMAKKQAEALLGAERKLQIEAKARAEAEEEVRLETAKRKLAETKSQEQIGLHAKEVACLNQKIQETEKALLKERTARSDAEESTSKIRADFQATIAKIKNEMEEAVNKERADSAKKLDMQKETISKIESENKRTIVNIRNELEEQIAILQANSDEAVANEKANSAKAADKVNDYAEELKQVKIQLEAEVNAKRDTESKLCNEIQKRKEIEAALKQQEDAMAKSIAMTEEKVKAETEKHILAETQDRNRRHTAEIASLTQKIQETEKALLKEKLARSDAEENTVKIKAEYQKTISKITSDADMSLSDIQTKHNDEVIKLISEAEATRKSAVQKLKSEMEAKAKDHEILLAKAENKADDYAEKLKQVKKQLKAEIKSKKKAEIKARKEISKRTRIETTLGLKEEKMAERIARAEEKARVETERKSRAKIEKLLIEEAQEQAKIKFELEDKVEAFAGKIAAIKTESERAIAEAKLRESEQHGLSSQIRQEVQAKTRRIECFDYDSLDGKKDNKRSTAGEDILYKPLDALLSVCAQDIMQTEIAWCSKEDNIKNALEQMYRQNVRYMLVGENGVVEGIVSRSDLKGALSPYLQPQFAKWRRPLDDATLQIRVKWVMSKPVHTIGCETELMAILNEIRQLDVLCFPVIDENRQVIGVVTKAEIFNALVTSNDETADQQRSLLTC